LRPFHHISLLALVALGALVAPASAQVPLPPLPPIGGNPPPPGGSPQPQQPPAPGPVSRAPGSVGPRVDVANSGLLPDSGLVPPLRKRWRVRARAPMLAAGGRVFAFVGTSLAAFDARNGHRLWMAVVDAGAGPTAYGDGRVYVSSGQSLIAFDAATGARAWTATLPGSSFRGQPVASGGAVYLAEEESRGKVYALSAADGHTLWTATTATGAYAPALDGSRLYVPDGCGTGEALDRRNGQRIWGADCSSGSGTYGAVHDGRFYTAGLDTSGFKPLTTLSAADGAPLGSRQGILPVFVDGLAVTAQSELTALREGTTKRAWRRRISQVHTLLAVGHDIYLSEGSHAYGLDSRTGRTIWSTAVHAPFETPELAAAPGLLLVESNDHLTAWESEFQPRPRGIGLGASSFDVFTRQLFGVGGVIGRDLRHGRTRVRFQEARWPGHHFHASGAVRSERDGGFSAGSRLRRNTRIRALVGRRRSGSISIFVYPRVRLGRARAAGSRVRLRPSVRAPGVRLSGHTFVLYLNRGNKGRLTRVAAGRIHGTRATLLYRPPRHLSSRDRVFFCVRGQVRLGLGRPSPLNRRCGARRIRLR
jgi:outer membrane protein assembly factor BamB